MWLYSQYRSVNSQVAEQRNSALVKLRSMVSYMNLPNFMKTVALFSFYHNGMAKAKMDHEYQYSGYFKKLAKATQRLK
jgi:hypothetical protein